MKIEISLLGGRLGHFLAGAVAASVLTGAATAVTGNNFTYKSPKTGWYTVAPGDLKPEASDAQTIQYSTSTIFFSSGKAPGEANCFFTSLHLPQGAMIKSVASIYDSGTEFNPFFRLEREKISVENHYEILDQSVSADNSGERRTLRATISRGRKVDNSVYAYHYIVCLGYKDNFYGARIAYEYSKAGD